MTGVTELRLEKVWQKGHTLSCFPRHLPATLLEEVEPGPLALVTCLHCGAARLDRRVLEPLDVGEVC